MRRFVARFYQWASGRYRKSRAADDESLVFPLLGMTPRVALVSMLGVPPDRVETILQSTAGTLSAFDRIVFLTNDTDFRPLRARRATFEYLPSVAEMEKHAADLPWPLYLREKRALIVSKWRPQIEITYGQNFDDYVAGAAGIAKA
jgi:hypothetical protein